MAVAFGDVFDGRDGFFFRFVCEHGAEGAVADDADMGKFGAILFVDYQTAFVVDFEADVFYAQAGSIGAAADGYKDNVGVKLGGKLASLMYGVW